MAAPSELWNANDVDPAFAVSDDWNSFYSLDYTFSYSKLSCVRVMHYVHLTFGFGLFFTGIACFVTRVVPRVKWMHPWFGRLYVLLMLWTMGASLLIHNTGIPLGVLYTFLSTLGGLSVGWIAIKFHESQLHAKACALVEAESRSGLKGDLAQLIVEAKARVVAARSFRERLVSYKSAHGIFFFMSWLTMAGQALSTNTGGFSCYSYPVFKPIDSKKFPQGSNSSHLTFVPVRDPKYERLPWANAEVQWGLAQFLGPILVGGLVGALYSWRASRNVPKVRSAGALAGSSAAFGPADDQL
jgi:hypothetical protein